MSAKLAQDPVAALEHEWRREAAGHFAECNSLVLQIESDLTLALLRPGDLIKYEYGQGLEARDRAIKLLNDAKTLHEVGLAKVEFHTAFSRLEGTHRLLAVQGQRLAAGKGLAHVPFIPPPRVTLPEFSRPPAPWTPPAPPPQPQWFLILATIGQAFKLLWALIIMAFSLALIIFCIWGAIQVLSH
jgi:hypothetical protein